MLKLLSLSVMYDPHAVTDIFSCPFFCSDKKGGKGKDHRNDSSDEEDSPQSGKIANSFIFFVIS